MAPQQEIPVAANVLGTIGTILWCVQLMPQVYTNWRTKKTDGLPSTMMFLWAICGVPFGTYAIVQKFNIPLQVQPQIFMVLCAISWAQTLLYFHKWELWQVIVVGTATTLVFGGIEAALILTLEPLYAEGNEMPIVVVGIVASILLAVGLLPPYREAWKRKGRIVGINWVFLCMDSLGAFFSLMSLAAQNSFDVLGGVMYIICILLEIGIYLSHIIWLLRTRKIRQEAKEQGKTIDDVIAEHEEQGTEFKFSERKSRRQERNQKRRSDEEMGHGSDCDLKEPPTRPVSSRGFDTGKEDGGESRRDSGDDTL
ncbi:PQ loop repeat-domain-containing protein [Biscogniauxia mediterranea]|nr:PQ loop repeat-domain-containing protein [Biscogniauxia mediterranea]